MKVLQNTMFHHSADYLDIHLGVSSDGRVFEWVTQEPVIVIWILPEGGSIPYMLIRIFCP